MKKISEFINEKIINNIKVISNKRTKLSLLISIIGLLCLAVGSSFALLQDNKEGTTKQVINVGKVKLELTESKTGINLENLIDMSDDEGFNQSEFYSFSISNIGDTAAEYNLLLVKDETKTNTLDEKYIKVGLEVNGDKVKILNLKDANNIIHSTVISKNEDIEYKLRLWLDPEAIGDETIEENTTLSLKLKVDATQYLGDTKKVNTLYSAMKGQVKTTNISYKYINDANVTEDGVTYNVNDNGVFLFNGTDDNGGNKPIYYYRGNVTNNNVLFGGFCWKIVRTTSTGGTKLIYNGVPSDDGKCNNTGTASQLSSKSAFNTNYTSPADVGYMYGTRYTYTRKDMSSITDTYKYGNDVTYSNGTYTLTGKTMDSSSWSTDRTTLADGYHYTCLNSTGTCTSVYYITYFGNSTNMYYLTFTGGDNLDSAKTKMFTNTTDSTIKTYIDNWYSTNLTNYTNMLENTIFCNDRSFASDFSYQDSTFNGGALAGKDVNAVDFSCFQSVKALITGVPSLTCTNINDRFSLKVDSGGTSGYGNNTLTYPVGLLTYDEAMLAGGTGTSANENYYLYNGGYYWLLSPNGWRGFVALAGLVGVVGDVNADGVGVANGVFPSVSLQPGTPVIRGTGISSDPYVITELILK